MAHLARTTRTAAPRRAAAPAARRGTAPAPARRAVFARGYPAYPDPDYIAETLTKFPEVGERGSHWGCGERGLRRGVRSGAQSAPTPSSPLHQDMIATVEQARVRGRRQRAREGEIKGWQPAPAPTAVASAPQSRLSHTSSAPPAQVLLSPEGGYTYLDVRPALELDEVGKFKGGVNVGLYSSVRKWDSEKGEKVVTKEENPDFVSQVEKKIPDKDTPIVVACSDGTAYSMAALEALDDAGYTNMVALKGGYYAWTRVWDANLRRRRGDGYTEAYDGDGSDSCGIHASGAGFERADKIEAWTPPKY